MKKKWIIPSALALLSVLIACQFAGISIDFGSGAGGGSGGSAVESGIDSPANGSSLPMGPVDISYHASSTAGVVAVELSINGAVASTFTSPDSEQKVVGLNYSWEPTQPGSHTIRVRAQDSAGMWSDFSAVTVNVQSAPAAEAADEAEEQEAAAPPEDEEEEEETTPPDTDEVEIYELTHAYDTFYYGGGGCNRENTISAKISNPDKVFYATLFIRLVDKEGEGNTKWDSGRSFSPKSGDTFSTTIFSEDIPNYSLYDFSIMEYQIIVRDKNQNDLVRTEVMRDISLEICQ